MMTKFVAAKRCADLQEAALSQGRSRDAASCMYISIGLRIEFNNGIARFLCKSTVFLYSPTSATAQMLKLHTV